MPLEIVTIPCLSDNYAFLIHNNATGETALVDAPESGPIKAALTERGWDLTHVLITHHHSDHVDGLDPLRREFSPQVIGAAADAKRLPKLDLAVNEGDALTLLGETLQIFDVSGHTIGHIAFYLPESDALFTADSLMALGCGHLFEGTPEMMFTSLQKLIPLPGDCLVYSGHEYTAHNARFAMTIEPGNLALQDRVTRIQAARAAGTATVPSTLQEERDTNPFLRAHLASVKAGVGLENADDVAVFAEVRSRRNNF